MSGPAARRAAALPVLTRGQERVSVLTMMVERSNGTRSPGEPDGTRQALTRERILDAALRRFARYGYRKTSMAEIARDLGVVKGALYYHVPGGKQELLDAVVSREEERLLARMTAAAEAAPDPAAALRAVIEEKLLALRELREVLGLRRELGEEFAALVLAKERDFSRQERALFARLLREGIEQGVFRPIPAPEATVRALQAMVRSLELPEMFGEEPVAGTELLEGLFRLVFHGLLAREGETPR